MWAVRDLNSVSEDRVFSSPEEANAYIKDNNLSFRDYTVVYIMDALPKKF